MSLSSFWKQLGFPLGFLLSLSSIKAALAADLPSLDAFAQAARRHDAETLAQRADEVAAVRDEDAAWLGLAPRLSAVAGYTRNEVEVGITLPQASGTERIVTTPEDQLDFTARAEIDLVDVPRWSRISSSGAGARAAAARTRATERRLDEEIVRAYYDCVGAHALEEATRRGAEVARSSLSVARERRAAGIGSELDERRAERDLAERARLVVDATEARRRAARRLERLSGLAADGRPPPLPDDLRPPPEEATVLAGVGGRPDVVAARSDTDRASSERAAAWATLAPRITATFSERFTNAAGFGVSPAWAAGVTATLTLDATSVGQGRAKDAAARAAELRARAAFDDAREDVRERHAEVVRLRSALAAATEERLAAEAAAKAARARDTAGTSTALDRLLAERDELSAQVEEVRARARLAAARALLELAVRP